MKRPRAIGRLITEEDSALFSRRALAPPSMDDDAHQMPLAERFEVREPMFSFDQIVLDEHVTREIDSVCARIQHHDTLYTEWGLSSIDPNGARVAINLYGPPGTGKTMCAEALARRFGKPILEVNYADVESKYVGETPKNIRAAFQAARNHNALLFFDEADSILGRRMTTVQQSADHSVNVSRAVMLRQMDIFEGIVVFATNLAKNYDAAFVRRIPFHIYMPLPDEACRIRLWKQLIPAQIPGRDHIDISILTGASDGLSGGDIKNAIVLASTAAVQREGIQRRLTTEDLTEAIGAVIRARQDVGSESYAH